MYDAETLKTAQAVAKERCAQILGAIDNLKRARNTLRKQGAKKAADYVARALKSVEGALHHAHLAPFREARQARSAN